MNELRVKVPPVVRELLRIPGLGPKKVATLWKELQFSTLDELKTVAEHGDVAKLKGFGAKTAQLILTACRNWSRRAAGTGWPTPKPRPSGLPPICWTPAPCRAVEPAGSCRRRQETCGDLDLLAAAADSTAAMDRLAEHSSVEQVLARGDTKQRVRLRMGIELDLRVVPEESFGAALQYFTGSKEHNIVLRRRAQERGLKINEYGVFRGEERVAGRERRGVYAALDLPWIPPELREDRGEFAAAEQGRLPRLIELDDIRGDLHMHTTATDGTASIREMVDAAKDRGLDVHRHHRPLQAGHDGQRPRRRPAASPLAGDRQRSRIRSPASKCCAGSSATSSKTRRWTSTTRCCPRRTG